MITIKRCPTGDSRTCDYANTPKSQLLESTLRHVRDVQAGLAFFAGKLAHAAEVHDADKFTDAAGFFADFQRGFAAPTPWLDQHRRINRHHLTHPDGVPANVNLLDVLECVVDCVVAGLARTGEFTPLHLDDALLQCALQNTVTLLRQHIRVVE